MLLYIYGRFIPCPENIGDGEGTINALKVIIVN